jgi:hypothetical protein
MSLSKIYEGWKNKLFPASHMKQLIEDTSKERMSHCNKCLFNSDIRKEKLGYKSVRPDVHCVNCGCTLSAKTRCLSCSCPENLWEALVTRAEEDEIKIDIDNENRESAS